MGVMDVLFGKSGGDGTPSTALPPSQIGPGSPTANNSGPTPAPAPAATGNAAAPKEPDSPLDSFKDIWQTPVDDAGKPIAPVADPLASPIFNFDPVKISAQAKTLDFVKDINPELVSGLVGANGTLDTAKLLELINTVQQNAFSAATLSAGNMVNQGINNNNARFKTTLPGLVRGVTLDDTPIGDNPVFEHPAVQPLVKALRQAEFAKNANADPAVVAKKINDYIVGLASAVQQNTPEALAVRQQEVAKATNWQEYMG